MKKMPQAVTAARGGFNKLKSCAGRSPEAFNDAESVPVSVRDMTAYFDTAAVID